MKYWIKLDRIAAWILLVCMVIYFISGFGMSKGIISYKTASYLHLDLLTMITILTFTMHGAFATRLALIRWRKWQGIMKVVWAIFFCAFLGSFVYIDRFYTPKIADQSSVDTTAQNSISDTSSSQSPSTSDVSSNTNDTSNSTQKVFTASSLSQYDGTNGQPAYVAVDSLVYDLSSVFRGGTHAGFSAGMDQSAAFHSHHNDSILSGYPVVGTYQP